jgi:glycosyltransferase involved in cell wall biosynthesis
MSKNIPKITIVTVTYNAEKFIERTIKSIIEQDYKNLEYIIIDGESTDNTLNIIKDYKNHISYFVSEPDEGVYDAMNKAINIATGEWINFMNAGDTFYEYNTISRMVPYIDNKIKILTGYVNLIDNNNNWFLTEFPMNIANINKEFRCNHQASFIKTNLAKKYPFNLHYKYASDVNFFFNLGLDNENYKILPFPVVNFIMGGMWQQNSIKAHTEILDILSKNLKEVDDIFSHTSFLELVKYRKERLNNNLIFNSNINKLIKQLLNIKKEHKKIILYGYGHMGHICELYLGKNILGIVDKDSKNNPNVIHPTLLRELEYDCILITVLGRENDIEEYLNDINVEKNKIIRLTV